MRNNFTLQGVTVNEHGVWDDYAEAQILVVESNQLIVRATADGIRSLWRRVIRGLEAGPRRHLPPI